MTIIGENKMDNNVKKLIALISSAAMLFSMAPMALAEDTAETDAAVIEEAPAADLEVAYTPENGVYYDEDFSSFASGTLVNLEAATSPNTTYEESNGMTFSMGSRPSDYGASYMAVTDGTLQVVIGKYPNGGRNPKITLSRTTGIEVTNDLVTSLDMNFKEGNTNNTITFVDSLNNEYTYSLSDDSYCGQNVNLTYAIREGSDVFVAKVGDQLIDLKFVETNLVDLASIYVSDATLITVSLDNITVKDEVFSLNSDDVFNFVGNELNIANGNANVTENGDAYDIIGGFTLPTTSIADASIEWKIYQVADGSDTREETEFLNVVDNATVEMDASKDFTGYTGLLVAEVSYNGEKKEFTYSINLPTVDTLLQNIANSFDILSGNTGITLNGSVYTVTKNFTVPSSDVVNITWQAYVAAKGSSDYTPSDIVTINSSNTSKITIPDGFDVAANDVKLVATISLRDASTTIEYPLDIQCGTTGDEIIYYDQNFSALPTGNLVACDGVTSNDTYADMGMTFVCGARGGGGGDKFNIAIEAPQTGTGNIMSFVMSDYASDLRAGPTMTLTKSRDSVFANGVYFSADITFTATNNNLLITDNNSTSFYVSLSDSESNLVGKSLTWKIVSRGGTTTAVAYDGATPVKVVKNATGLKNVTSIGIETNVVTQKISVANMYIADSTYAIPDADIFAADTKSFDLVANGVTKTSVDGQIVYSLDSIRDITLPTLTFSSIEWKAYQKEKGASDDTWTETSFLVANGNTLGVYPTSEINNYDVKLVATITYGSAETAKEFTMQLPNPDDELKAALESGYEVVTSNDDATKQVNLSLKPVLKYDIKLPSSITGSRNVTVSWKSSDEEHIKLNNNVAEIYTQDMDSHDVTLTATVKYKKGTVEYSQDVEFPVSVAFTEEDKASTDAALDKYKVRFDTAYEANFSGIPSSASSNITLPTEAYFGSKISWLSSAPTVISNTGAYKRPSSTKNVILTATIMSGASSESKNFEVRVAGSSSSGGGGGGGGGSVSSTGTVSGGSGGGALAGNNVTTIPDKVTGQEIVDDLLNERYEAENAFSDLGSVVWARDAINALAEKGIVNGKTETTFAPNDNVTRAEFAKMLMGTFGLGGSVYTTSSFNDVSTDAWYFSSVETAYNLGIITGVGNGMFAPDALISRQEMAVMVQRAAKVCGKTPAAVQEATVFADDADIADYAKEAVTELNAAGIINGVSATSFAPLSNATRAQAAKILYSFL